MRPHSPRAKKLKLGISGVFIAGLIIDSALVVYLIVLANLFWLWADFE